MQPEIDLPKRKLLKELKDPPLLLSPFKKPPKTSVPKLLLISSFPPRKCGIASFSEDLTNSLKNRYGNNLEIEVCALESTDVPYCYRKNVKYILDTRNPESYRSLFNHIKNDRQLDYILVQHEFGLFKETPKDLIEFLKKVEQPILTTLHTVLPQPESEIFSIMRDLCNVSEKVVVMTNSSKQLLRSTYGIPESKIATVTHGLHLRKPKDKDEAKKRKGLSLRTVLTTFGFVGPGKNIETTLQALPQVIKEFPNILFLVIGRTHPDLIADSGESYREYLEQMVHDLDLEHHVLFINKYAHLDELLEYLQLSDIYLFTSKDPNQAVSGTLSYAISSGCPIISTPIPHALEVLNAYNCGTIVDFENPESLSEAIKDLLLNETKLEEMKINTLLASAISSWDNSAIQYSELFQKTKDSSVEPSLNPPSIDLEHIKSMTSPIGVIQFSKYSIPDPKSGYTLDDNARALIAFCKHIELSNDLGDLDYIRIYFYFLKSCFQESGSFFNYRDINGKFTPQNEKENLEDANGRAIWALGYLLSLKFQFPSSESRIMHMAEDLFLKVLPMAETLQSPRAISFAIKGLYQYNKINHTIRIKDLTKKLAYKLVTHYNKNRQDKWKWFEQYLTYANPVIPDALLSAYLVTDEEDFKIVAKESMDFLLSKLFENEHLEVIKNDGWYTHGEINITNNGAEQPIDVSYLVLALKKFVKVFPKESYKERMNQAFNWFLGKNRLNPMVYNSYTGGCYDGLGEHYINLNQGAESSICYLMARLEMDSI